MKRVVLLFIIINYYDYCLWLHLHYSARLPPCKKHFARAVAFLRAIKSDTD